MQAAYNRAWQRVDAIEVIAILIIPQWTVTHPCTCPSLHPELFAISRERLEILDQESLTHYFLPMRSFPSLSLLATAPTRRIFLSLCYSSVLFSNASWPCSLSPHLNIFPPFPLLILTHPSGHWPSTSSSVNLTRLSHTWLTSSGVLLPGK